MKLSTILSANIIATSAMASSTHPNLHAVADLIARAIDPATMDPTKLSVLSVLKTAMPTATDATLPTGSAAPQWYKDLPADVMVLLAQMYPVTPTAAAEIVSETTGSSSNVSSSLAQETAAVSVSQTTLTRTLELVPTATSNATALSTGSSADSAANGTLSTGSPSPTQSAFSTGAKNAVATGKWSFVVGLGVAMCFFAFA